MIEMPECFWQNKLYHETKMFHWNLSSCTALQKSLTGLYHCSKAIPPHHSHHSVAKCCNLGKSNPIHPSKKYGSEIWGWKGIVQVSSFSHKLDLSWAEIICSFWFLSFHMTEGSWVPAAPTSMVIQPQDTIFYLFLNIIMGLLAEIWVWLERGKHQNLRGNWLSIGQSWCSQLGLRDICPISAEIVQITEIRPLESGAHTCFRDCNEQLNSRRTDASGWGCWLCSGEQNITVCI